MTALDTVSAAAAEHRLAVIGAFHPGPEDGLPTGTETLVLLGPLEPGFWQNFIASPEWNDGTPDPMDRWSRRVIGTLACTMGAKALFPFGGPPHRPFYKWALRTGRIWPSPVRLLVHDEAGLMVSFRGALALKERLTLPRRGKSPCDTCRDKPCLAACPAGALTADGYDVAACHGFLDSRAGIDCMSAGCRVRRACPVSMRHARMEEQSAYHMGQFHT